MASRTGVPTSFAIAKALCIALAKFGDKIKALDPENTDLSNAIDNAMLSCSVLLPLLDAVREYGD